MNKQQVQQIDLKTKVLFCVSDIHGFADELKVGLKEAGYDKRNKDHILVVVGDIFDRGPKNMAVYNFLKSVPKSRRILIKGNHESLYFELLNKEYPQDHDFSNCTVDTMCEIAGVSTTVFDEDTYAYDWTRYQKESKISWNKITEIVRISPITKWLESDEWLDYAEVGNYIFTHSFIPVRQDDGLSPYYIHHRKQSYRADWRNASADDWEGARWGCPWRQYKAGLFKAEEEQGKTLVVGHWHASDFYENLKNVYGSERAIYYSKGIIAIDGGVTRTWFYGTFVHPQNVLVIHEGICYGSDGHALSEIPDEGKIETVPASEIE